MIVPPTGVRVLVATKPVDFRKGMDGLAAYVEQQLLAVFERIIGAVQKLKRAETRVFLDWPGRAQYLKVGR